MIWVYQMIINILNNFNLYFFDNTNNKQKTVKKIKD